MHDAMDQDWDAQLVSLLTELSAAQDDLLTLLGEKRTCLMTADAPGMRALEPRESDLLGRLQGCLDRRASLLNRSQQAGRPAESLRALAAGLPPQARRRLRPELEEAAHRARLLQHESLTNWVIVQRTLLHLSGLLEVIATGGRSRPTYARGTSPHPSGSLVDRAA